MMNRRTIIAPFMGLLIVTAHGALAAQTALSVMAS